ncbi:MAG: response regulator [Humidesulfovibrio sp.]
MSKKIKLLLVDDEENFINTLAERMQMRDMGSDVAHDGETALEMVKDEAPDVMVLDLRMPGIDGVEVLRKVKKAHPHVQVIILTGHGSEQDQELCMQLGAYEYHKKPVDIDRLVKSIKGAYRQKMEDMMVAATFAQAGDFEDADQVIHEQDKK